MKGFVINLDKDHGRWQGSRKLLGQLGIDVARIPAVDGAQLTPVPSLNQGELGCFYSHCSALSTFLQSGDQNALIFEDDVSTDITAAEFKKSLEVALRHIPKFDIIYFGKCFCECSSLTPVEDDLYHAQGALCLHAYMVSREGAAKLLSVTQGVPKSNLDTLYKKHSLSGVLRCAVFHPSLFKQDVDTYKSHLRSQTKAKTMNNIECSGVGALYAALFSKYWWVMVILLILLGVSLFKYFY